MKILSVKTTSDHLLLCVFLSLLWAVTDSAATSQSGKVLATTVTSATKTQPAARLATTPSVTSTTKAPPDNVASLTTVKPEESSITLGWNKVNDMATYTLQYDGNEENIDGSSPGTSGDNSTGHTFTAATAPENVDSVNVATQNQSSITLEWNKVNAMATYILQYDGKEENIDGSSSGASVRYVVSPLTAGTKYSFTLLTVFEGVNSTGFTFTAATAPENVDSVNVATQNQSSITLEWNKVNAMATYILQYDGKEENIDASSSGTSVRYVVSPLTAGTKYSFTLLTVFEGVNSTGFTFTAATAPENVDSVNVATQNQSSITLEWNKVNAMATYILQYDGKEENIDGSSSGASVRYVVSPLTAGTKYSFTLLTVFEGVNSTGFTFTAATAPENVDSVNVATQNQSSITLEWNKVNAMATYILQYDGKVENIDGSSSGASVRYVVSPLTAGTKYSFTLLTVFEGVNSTGFTFTAATAPENVDSVNVATQNQSSITLEWNKVNAMATYILQYDGKEENIDGSSSGASVRYVVSPLTAGTKYSFTLLTVFEGVNSTGFTFTAATAPENVDSVNVATQNQSSITLEWNKVNAMATYILQYDGKEENIDGSSSGTSVRYVVSPLTAGTKYSFTLLTVFEGVNSTGFTFTAATAPENVDSVNVATQNQSSITLEWNKVNAMATYILQYDGKEENIDGSSSGASVRYVVSPLTAGTKYSFTLITVFEGVNSTEYTFTAVTAPRNSEHFKSVGQNKTSITLQWQRVDGFQEYRLFFNGEIDINSSAELVTHTISYLTSGNVYSFRLFTLFENVKSSGVNLTAVTAPESVKNVTVLTQNENSITLMWDKVKNISTYTLLHDGVDNGYPIQGNSDASLQEVSVMYEVSMLSAGTEYYFTLITVFEGVNSTGFTFTAATVPPMVPSVSVTERSVTNITLKWENANKAWEYMLQIDGRNVPVIPDRFSNIVSHVVPSLKPGTMYEYSVSTVFLGLNSTAYENITVTAIDCASVNWRVTNSSIHGTVEGLFSNATATYKSLTHVSPGAGNVSFTGLYPGATYGLYLEYELSSIRYSQCNHYLTVLPPDLRADCKYWASGYSVRIVWDKPDGVVTHVEVNVNGKYEKEPENEEHQIIIPGFQPAKTYKVFLTSLSEETRSDEPVVLFCKTDPRGVIAGSVFAVLLFGVLVCLAVLIFLKRPDIISRKKSFIGGSKQSKTQAKPISVAKFPDHFSKLSSDENRGFSQEYEGLIPVGTDQTQRAAILPENKVKNRFNNVLPYDWCRVKLSTSVANGTSDYINANYMPGYNSNREYIATQGPLPSSVNDFWRMIWEQRVKGIVMVTNCTEVGKIKCEQYWPADSKPCLHGELLVTVRSEQHEPNWTLREFSVKHKNTSEERTVKHFHFTAWPDHGVPHGTEVLIQFRGLVRQHINREGSGAPTVVHCSAGVGRTGTIIALDVLLQQLEKERGVGINSFVHKMRLNRPYMVQTEPQYVFLHQCIMDCLQPKNTEENIYENADMIYANATALRELR